MIKKMQRNISLIIYYLFAKYLPAQPIPGWKISYAFRRFLCKFIFEKCGENIFIKRNAYFGKGDGIIIGDNSQIGEKAFIGAHTKIGKNVIMGPDVIIWSISHRFESINIPINQQGNTSIQPVQIGDDVWIGQRVIIKPGLKIGNHSIVGAGSIVTKDIPSWSIVAGSPAKIIKKRI